MNGKEKARSLGSSLSPLYQWPCQDPASLSPADRHQSPLEGMGAGGDAGEFHGSNLEGGSIRFPVTLNEQAGDWAVEATGLRTGRVATTHFVVE